MNIKNIFSIGLLFNFMNLYAPEAPELIPAFKSGTADIKDLPNLKYDVKKGFDYMAHNFSPLFVREGVFMKLNRNNNSDFCIADDIRAVNRRLESENSKGFYIAKNANGDPVCYL